MPKKPSKSPAGKGPRTAARKPARVAAKRPTAASKEISKAAPDLTQERIVRALETIAAHLSAQGNPAAEPESFERADAYVWHPDGRLAAVPRVSRVELFLLKGVDRMRDILMENTERFANGLRDKSADELLRDVRNLARRQPALFIGGSVAVGILAARFLKSSRDGETREFYQGGYSSGNRPYQSSEAALSTSIPPRDFVADVDTDDVGRIGRERM